MIERFIEEGSGLYCAGGLFVESEITAPYIQRINSVDCDVKDIINSAMGLPTTLLSELMKNLI